MYSRNKQKDKNPMGGFLSVKLLSAGLPMSVLSIIYTSLSASIGGTV